MPGFAAAFRGISAIAVRRGEIALGLLRRGLGAGDPFGMRIAPPWDEPLVLGAEDSVVVLSEDLSAEATPATTGS